MQQFAISEATLFGWNSMDGESMGAGSNQGSVAHLSEVNQESITSRGTGGFSANGYGLSSVLLGVNCCSVVWNDLAL